VQLRLLGRGELHSLVCKKGILLLLLLSEKGLHHMGLERPQAEVVVHM